jgi:hypothetical protein
MYKCELCNYETRDSGNFSHHKKSKKHVQNVDKNTKIKNKNIRDSVRDPVRDPIEIQLSASKNTNDLYTCQYCDQKFKHKTNLYRHQKHRCEVITGTKDVQTENLELKKQNEKLIDIVQKQTNTVESNAETIKKSMNVLSFVTKQYPNAPPIEELEYDKFNKITKCLMYDNKTKKKTKHPLEDRTLFACANNFAYEN